MKKKKPKYEFHKGLCVLLEVLSKIIGSKLQAKVYKTKSFKSTLKHGPIVVISNHTSAFEFIFVSKAMAYHKLNFMVAENLKYASPLFSKLITKYNAIPKRQYYSDIKSIKGVKSCLDSGISVLVCPEGKVAASGVTGVIPESIARFLQWLNYPVGVIKVEGGGLKHPKWAKDTRKGKVKINCDILFTQEDLKNLSKEDIYNKVKESIYHNNHLWQEENHVIVKSPTLAEGLEGLLYKCPRCGKEFSMETNANIIKCNSCGLQAKYLENGQLEYNDDFNGPKRIDLWYEQIVASVDDELKEGLKPISMEVDLNMEKDTHDGYKKINSGILTIDGKNIIYFSDSLDEYSSLSFNTINMETVCYLPGDSIEFYDDKHVYKFVFSKYKASTKYALIVEEAYKINHTNY